METEKEQLILKAAEEEFLEKGYNGAKTTSIARRAGVTHAMLHYYYRTKEHIFNMVFGNKVQLIAESLIGIFDEDWTFEDMISQLVHAHFYFIKDNPRLPQFVLNEVIANKENRDLLFETVMPIISKVFDKVDAMVKAEVKKGTIRPIDTAQLLMNIFSLNVTTFLIYPVIKEYKLMGDEKTYDELLTEREVQNAKFILAAISKD